ncbi:MAG: YbhN family protein [Actinoplanes sp.]
MREWLRRHGVRLLVGVVAAAAVVVALRGRVPHPADVVSVLAAADFRWLAAAVLGQFLSQAAFARQQRALLSAFAVQVSRGDALAITYSRSAMSMVLPAGSAMSAAFALRQYRRRGASTSAAATVMVLSAMVSVVGLALLYAGTIGPGALPLIGALAVLSGVLVLLRRRPAADAEKPAREARWRWVGRALAQVRVIAAQTRSVRSRHWAAAIAFAVLNWLLDLGCLVTVAHAVDLPLGFFPLATVYLAVQVVRQIPLTPGGVGLIEASLLTGLVAAGAPQASAAAVVLGYRVVSFWLLLPAGLFAYLRLNRRAGETPVTAV